MVSIAKMNYTTEYIFNQRIFFIYQGAATLYTTRRQFHKKLNFAYEKVATFKFCWLFDLNKSSNDTYKNE